MGRARRRVQPWFVGANAWLLLASTALFLLGAWIVEAWIAHGVRDAVLGLGAGAVFGAAGMRLDRLEWADRALYRTPHRGLLLVLAFLLATRVVLGLWLAWHAAPSAGWSAWLDRGGLLAVAGVLLGHATWTAWGLRARLRRGPPGSS
jgi:hypothetical protein